MSAILVRNGDCICDLCIYKDSHNYNDNIDCPIGCVPEVVDESIVGDITVCDGYTTNDMVTVTDFKP